MELDLSTGAPPSPERTIHLAETAAEIFRVMNHATMHHEALRYPSDADRLIREIATAASRLPQLLSQAGTWLAREDEAERIEIPSGENAGNPLLATVTAREHLETAGAIAVALQRALESAASATSAMAAREDGGDE